MANTRTTQGTSDLAFEALFGRAAYSEDLKKRHVASNIVRSGSGIPLARNIICPTDVTHFDDTCIRDGYVSKAAMINELISSGERLEEYRSRTYYQGSYDPVAVAREEESMMVYPQARHDYDFDDFYADSELIHTYFRSERLKAILNRDELNNANNEDASKPSDQKSSDVDVKSVKEVKSDK